MHFEVNLDFRQDLAWSRDSMGFPWTICSYFLVEFGPKMAIFFPGFAAFRQFPVISWLDFAKRYLKPQVWSTLPSVMHLGTIVEVPGG